MGHRLPPRKGHHDPSSLEVAAQLAEAGARTFKELGEFFHRMIQPARTVSEELDQLIQDVEGDNRGR